MKLLITADMGWSGALLRVIIYCGIAGVALWGFDVWRDRKRKNRRNR